MINLKRLHKQQGVALITVMLIVALCAVIASQMTARLQVQMQRSANVSFNQQAYWYAMGAEAFTKRVLIKVFQAEPNVTNLSQAWAGGENTFPVDFGEITGEITDLQSCLNLNALRAPFEESENTSSRNNRNQEENKAPARLAFEALLINLQLENVSQFEAESMADALTDWLDADTSISSAGGAEDNDYASREFPYLAANNYLASVNELRVVEHFTPAIINAIKPYVCVIPGSELHQVNINTIDSEHVELLQALLGSTLEQAQDVLSARGEKGFDSLDTFYNLPTVVQIENFNDKKDSFAIDSEYFNLKASASFNESYYAMNSVMKITENKYINVLSRTVGRN
ncbi:type II secretion system minor pseudopilin GspK [Colwellia sp. 4_MG-2023]|uniref:type II secretion system minor pseudopilin GspK n=1 Tax=unclassified Colwellia TaxID=196834 RepID=UPI001C09ACA2|nr:MULTISPECIES: type II secretion system minor pseudopilin GspK [unclassified Colwellia]MBU2923112.1 type II secretion system minor pseudopilin GspK [Colwellia sp. C2M11]MDO6508828.1 type II secretion system minor pseudopilin GspK [Colwellia sp. 5_MG-2023]MDO6557508.1 type II secretion system minor pseudopilin GspK [Colwellia sp. 4_MG-2023]MDO6654197.1 type II secretion system minor pseudopilin GspK [Colwellia sp. 3_MG-2023]MDO6667239.1 type II secretion system minor pseudopilin GspK [Colwell